MIWAFEKRGRSELRDARRPAGSGDLAHAGPARGLGLPVHADGELLPDLTEAWREIVRDRCRLGA